MPAIDCYSSNLRSETYESGEPTMSIRDKNQKGTTEKMSKITSSTDLLFNAYLEKRKVLEDKEAKIREEIAKLDDAATTFGLFNPVFGHPKSVEEVTEKPSFIKTVLDVINDAPFGSHLTTGEVQTQAEKRLGQKLAKATGSSALARLAKEGSIVRVARNQWRAK